MTDTTLRQALAYARHGWPVFPCHPGRKTPATPHGYLDATTDPAQIRAWFARRPELKAGRQLLAAEIRRGHESVKLHAKPRVPRQ